MSAKEKLIQSWRWICCSWKWR